ncbi:hypothetical protein WEB32_01515 [Streptomyces netropsis]|uniref:Uncharacterized protein n=1 Tax=Streptomyces netropsis TaxID=55404 RepID=A0A7W7LDY8_STRNE|nr:hypothetical protein [Streptomyces netropsis]MBB4888202.1 hypothetical protein [Streptomyces netropsis]
MPHRRTVWAAGARVPSGAVLPSWRIHANRATSAAVAQILPYGPAERGMRSHAGAA